MSEPPDCHFFLLMFYSCFARIAFKNMHTVQYIRTIRHSLVCSSYTSENTENISRVCHNQRSQTSSGRKTRNSRMGLAAYQNRITQNPNNIRTTALQRAVNFSGGLNIIRFSQIFTLGKATYEMYFLHFAR